VRYAFIKAPEQAYPVRRLCRVMAVHPSGYYAWRAEPESARALDDRRLLGRIKQSWLESGSIYGYRKVHDDLRELGEPCGAKRVARLMHLQGLKAQRGYGRRPGQHGGKPAVVAPNHLQRAFEVHEPNRVWVTDITYIRTHEGWLYLAVVLDLFSQQVIGWSMQPRIDRELAINALLMAVWRRRPTNEVLMHSDQGSQFSSYDWQDFLKEHRLKPSMSRRGNCHDNAVSESFFQLLKRERIRRRTYATRDEARQDVFDYIEMFYNPKCRHGNNNRLSPVDFERQYFSTLASV
jgi:putative transposase